MREATQIKKLKIMMVNLCFLPESTGGSEFYTYHLSKALLLKGFDVTVLTTIDDKSLERYEVVHVFFDGIKVIKIANSPYLCSSFTELFIDPKVRSLFIKLIEEERPGLVHFQHLAYLSGNLPEVAHQLKVPSIFTLHDYWPICFRSNLVRPDHGICPGPSHGMYCASCNGTSVAALSTIPGFPLLSKIINAQAIAKVVTAVAGIFPLRVVSKMEELLKTRRRNAEVDSSPDSTAVRENLFRFEFFKKQFQFPRFVLSPSNHLKSRFEREGYREILVLPLGFHEARKVDKLPFNGKLKIAYLGNILQNKGVGVILSELCGVPDMNMIEINIYGSMKDPYYSSKVEEQARIYPKEVVRFHGGYRSDKDLPGIMANNHVMVFPSLWEENYPLVIRETLLHGVPVIASNLGGVPEVIKNGINGFLFDPYKKGDLLDKVAFILKNPQILEKITEGARMTKIEKQDDHVSKICELYDRALMR